MPKGYFRVFRDQNNERDIHFQQVDLADGETIPDDQLELRDSVDSTLTTLRLLFADKERFERYFPPLLSLAQLGLVGPSANPSLAVRALKSLQDEIVAREGGPIKNGYMKRLGGWALALGAPVLLAAGGIEWYLATHPAIVGFLLLWVGCMGGVWLSFGARKMVVTFEELGVLEQDRLSPPIRLVFAGLLTSVLGLLMYAEVVVVQLGGLSTKKFMNDAGVALLIGALCGISELALSAKVSRHARDVLGIK